MPKILWFVIFFLSANAFAATEENSVSTGEFAGPYALVEWNPADLQNDRIRVASEVLYLDGFAFGGAVELRQRIHDQGSTSFGKDNSLRIGFTGTQYLDSYSLKGPYIKGEFNAYVADVTIYKQAEMADVGRAQDGWVMGSALGADLGYRIPLAKSITANAAYGVRRNIPGFFEDHDSEVYEYYDRMTSLWDYRVQLALGLAF